MLKIEYGGELLPGRNECRKRSRNSKFLYKPRQVFSPNWGLDFVC